MLGIPQTTLRRNVKASRPPIDATAHALFDARRAEKVSLETTMLGEAGAIWQRWPNPAPNVPDRPLEATIRRAISARYKAHKRG